MGEYVRQTFPKSKITSLDVAPEKSYTHLLSHQKIEARFWKIKVSGTLEAKGNYRLIAKNEIDQYAVPRLIHRYLEDTGLV